MEFINSIAENIVNVKMDSHGLKLENEELKKLVKE